MITAISPETLVKMKWAIAASLIICVLYAGYQDRLNWYYEFSTSEKGYAQTGIADCRFHLRYFPNDWKLHCTLADYLDKDAIVTFDKPKRQALLRESIREYGEAIRLNPNDADTYCNLADLYDVTLENHRTANIYYKKCVGLEPTNSLYQNRLANNYRDLGQTKEADYHDSVQQQLDSYPKN